MQNKQATWELISRSLQSEVPVMLLYVVESLGSSPGRRGFAMAVNMTGETAGSIGGGIMEHKFVEKAIVLLQSGCTVPVIRQQVHDKTGKHQSGMICSGSQTIVLHPLSTKDLPVIHQLIHATFGVLQLTPAGISYLLKKTVTVDIRQDDWLYEELLGLQDKVFIIGGGHCALALSKILRLLNFYVHVFDTRPDLPTLQQNDLAHEKTIIDDYSEVAAFIPDGHYVVIMTMGYRTDDLVLRTLFGKQFKYWGVLGSQAKIDKMMKEYKAEGIPGNILASLHAPIGIPVKSQTPEEIAVSIAAEIISVKNN